MKKIVGILLAFALLLPMLVIPAQAQELPHVTLVVMGVEGVPTTRTEPILAKINEIVEREINATLEIQNIAQESYNITLTAIEGVDLITSADYLSYYDNARKAAYLPIAEEDLQTYCPLYYADHADKLPSAAVDGVLYAVPNTEPNPNAPCMILRKDLMDKYGIEEVNSLEDLDRYFAAILENEPNMKPFAMDTGLVSWITGAFAFGATGLMAPGGPNCTSVVALRKGDDPNYTLLRTWEQPELAEFFKVMKDFREKNYWTQDVLANPIPLNEAFRNGMTGVAWQTNPATVNMLYAEMKVLLPEAELAVYDLGAQFDIPIDTYSPMGGALSIPRTSKNYERALMFIELLYSNEELSKLFSYGVEGEDYTLNEKNEITLLNPDAGLGYWNSFTGHQKFAYEPDGGNWPGYANFIAGIHEREQQNPFVSFGFDTTPVSSIAANLWNIHMEYAVPIYLGLVDDVDAAIAELNRQYELADIATYEQEVFDQMQNFIEVNGLEATLSLPE